MVCPLLPEPPACLTGVHLGEKVFVVRPVGMWLTSGRLEKGWSHQPTPVRKHLHGHQNLECSSYELQVSEAG